MCSSNEAVEVFLRFPLLDFPTLNTPFANPEHTDRPLSIHCSLAPLSLSMSVLPNYNSPFLPILLSFLCCLSKVCGPAPSHHCHLLLTAMHAFYLHCNWQNSVNPEKEMDFPVLPHFRWIHCLQNEKESTFWRLKVESCCFSHGSFWIYFYASG